MHDIIHPEFICVYGGLFVFAGFGWFRLITVKSPAKIFPERVRSRAVLPFMQQAFAHRCLCWRWKKLAINTDPRPALRFQDLSETAGLRSVCGELISAPRSCVWRTGKSLRYALQLSVCFLCFHFYMGKLLYEN